ncbi:MAG: hypothetical protein ACREB8_04350 [Pseudolabrys sp.]
MLMAVTRVAAEDVVRDHPRGESEHHGHGGSGIGTATGIGIGIVNELIRRQGTGSDDCKSPTKGKCAVRKTESKKPKRAAKKDNKKPPQQPNPPVLTDDAPKAPTDKPSGPQPGGPTTTDNGGDQTAAPVAPLTKCCSCLDSLRLTYMGAGPKQTPDTLVDVPDDEAGVYKTIKAIPPTPSHRFKVTIVFNTIKSKDQGNLTLRWFERSDRVPTAASLAGQEPGHWVDQQDLLPNSQVPVNKKTGKRATPDDKPADITTFGKYVLEHGGTATNWIERYQKKKANVCKAKAETDSMYIDDEPAAARPRRLDFDIIVESPRNCNCPTAALELYATQIIAADPKEKNEAKIGKASQTTPNTGMYGPQGKLVSPGDKITGVPPAAPQPVLPAE